MPQAVAAEYAPFVEAAFTALALQLDSAKAAGVSGDPLPSGRVVHETIQSAIERAQSGR